MDVDSVTWRSEAACDGVDTEMFYPPRDKALYKTIADQAKKYCFGDEQTPPCPVRLYCLWEAISFDDGNGEQHGIWGGLSHRERNALVRKWQRQYKGTMTLKEYVFQSEKKGKTNGSSKDRP